jgi:hypothetical protein
MEELDRLEAEAEATRDAVREHLRHAIAARYEGGEAIGTATGIDRDWFDRHAQLEDDADKAEAAVRAYLKRERRG